jgi:hypothetical protein
MSAICLSISNSTAQGGGPFGPHRDVGVEPDRALLESGVGDTELGNYGTQLRGIDPRLGGASDVGLRHDLDQWHTRPVEIEQRRMRRMDATPFTHMGRLPRVLLHVGTFDADPAGLSVDDDVQVTVVTDRDVELGDLIVLGEVGVEVVLPVEHRSR